MEIHDTDKICEAQYESASVFDAHLSVAVCTPPILADPLTGSVRPLEPQPPIRQHALCCNNKRGSVYRPRFVPE